MSRPAAPIVVVGAGAAGLMAAIHAASTKGTKGGKGDDGNPVILVESTRDGGRKILISGGGRCNILPGELDESRFVTDSSPNTMRKMLRSWPLGEQRAFFEGTLGIPLRLETPSGKLFPASNRARDVRDALVDLARRRGVDFLTGTTAVALDRVASARGDTPATESGARWLLRSREGHAIEAASVILATGGLSVPKTGSDGTGLLLARGLGHQVHEPYAALTPLVCDPPRFGDLAGISLDVTLTAPRPGGRRASAPQSHGGFLFTHRGYSGPAVLDLSHLAARSRRPAVVREVPGPGARTTDGTQQARETPKQRFLVQWTGLDRQAWQRELSPRRATVLGALRTHLPARLAEALVREAGVAGARSLAELRSTERTRLLAALTEFELPWTGDEGYRTAEVTGGGVALSEVHPRTMESRRCPGLFLCGEILDAFGPIGGYNFLWAWATGRAAGIGARESAAA